MKKLLLLTLSLFSVGFLAGCNNSPPEGYTDNDDKFRTFNFVRKLDDDEKKALTDVVTNNAKNLTSLTFTTEQIVDKDNEKSNKKAKGEVTIFTDTRYPNNAILKLTSENEENETKNGININDKYSETNVQWDTSTSSSAEKRVLAYRTETIRKEKSKVDVECFDSPLPSKDIKKSTYERYLFSISSSDAYEDSNGKYTYVTSSKKKTVTTVEYGESTKDEIKWEYSQNIYELNEQSQLVKYVNYSRTKTNRDEDTKDWYSDIKIVSSSYTTFEYKYETRASESIDTLNNSIKDHVSFSSITGTAFNGNATGTSRSADDITMTHTGSSQEQSFSYVDKTSETSRIIEYTIHLDPYSGEPGNYTFSNVALKFSATTRTGYQAEETSNHFINFNSKLPIELDDVIIKDVTNGDDKYYYLINTSNKDVDLKVQMKLTASNYTIVSCEIA